MLVGEFISREIDSVVEAVTVKCNEKISELEWLLEHIAASKKRLIEE